MGMGDVVSDGFDLRPKKCIDRPPTLEGDREETAWHAVGRAKGNSPSARSGPTTEVFLGDVRIVVPGII